MKNICVSKFYEIAEKISRIKICYIIDIFKLFILAPISLIFKPILNKKNIWLIEENPMEANDNGYALLKYIKKNKKDINVYYVINKKSKQIGKVKQISNIIYDKSLKHWIYYFNAKVIVITQKYANPSPAIFYILHNLGLIKGKRVFLQHGIIYNDIKCYYYNVCKFDLFICGAKKEYEFVKNNYGYPVKNVVYTGLARFDEYAKNRKMENFIIIAPTWRNWIKCKNKEYKYFKKWNELINNQKFQEFLEKNDINAKVVLHQEMNKFKNKIQTTSKNIVIYENDEINYNEILSKCLMLITDFSSVFFDVAYMKKPIIYFQFDEEEFRKKHLKKGYFSYKNDGIGESLKEANDVVDKIKEYKENKFQMEEKYLKRVNDFFERRDEKNCDRIFEEILKIK